MSVFINNLDDFIGPSQACINPFVLGTGARGTDATSIGRVEIVPDQSVSDFEQKPDLIKIKANSVRKVATVSLNDCLACSGCVTSAETILIQEQSYSKLLEAIESPHLICVVCLSPQSVASIATLIKLSVAETFLRVAAVLKGAGVEYVFDSSCASDIALIEARNEFFERYYSGRKIKPSSPEYLSTAISSTRINVFARDSRASAAMFDNNVASQSAPSGTVLSERLVGTVSDSCVGQPLPMLLSSCPGWICYAEKTVPEALEFISSGKSPQQILGTLVKSVFCEDILSVVSSRRMLQSPRIFVASVQPCFDKKLEASRKDFYHEDWDQSEVDLVLSTTELWNLLEELGKRRSANTSENLGSVEVVPTASTTTTTGLLPFLLSLSPDHPHGKDWIEMLLRCFSQDGANLTRDINANSGSGGVLEYVLRQASHRMFGVDVPVESIVYNVGRNLDIAEVEIPVPSSHNSLEGIRPLRFGKAYGFRNIQNILRKMKMGKLELDVVEVMACPSGCANGGGQIKYSSIETAAETTERVHDVSLALQEGVYRSPEDSSLVQYLYEGKIPDVTCAEHVQLTLKPRSCGLLRTRYHAIPKLEVLAPASTRW